MRHLEIVSKLLEYILDRIKNYEKIDDRNLFDDFEKSDLRSVVITGEQLRSFIYNIKTYEIFDRSIIDIFNRYEKFMANCKYPYSDEEMEEISIEIKKLLL